MKRTFAKKRLLAVLVVGIVLAGAAAAYFSSAGAGMSTAAVGTLQPLTVTPGTPTAQLYPGGRADVVATISNPNGIDVHVASLALDTSHGSGGFAVDGSHSGCDAGALGYTTQSSGWTVPANGSLDLTLANALSMAAGAANACQGAVFTVYLQAGS
jgi:hypothetical protein